MQRIVLVLCGMLLAFVSITSTASAQYQRRHPGPVLMDVPDPMGAFGYHGRPSHGRAYFRSSSRVVSRSVVIHRRVVTRRSVVQRRAVEAVPTHARRPCCAVPRKLVKKPCGTCNRGATRQGNKSVVKNIKTIAKGDGASATTNVNVVQNNFYAGGSSATAVAQGTVPAGPKRCLTALGLKESAREFWTVQMNGRTMVKLSSSAAQRLIGAGKIEQAKACMRS